MEAHLLSQALVAVATLRTSRASPTVQPLCSLPMRVAATVYRWTMAMDLAIEHQHQRYVTDVRAHCARGDQPVELEPAAPAALDPVIQRFVAAGKRELLGLDQCCYVFTPIPHPELKVSACLGFLVGGEEPNLYQVPVAER